MTDFTEPATGPIILNNTLAELEYELRHSSSPAIHDGPLPEQLTFLRVAAVLLGEVSRETPGHGYGRCGGCLSALIDAWENAPGRFDSDLQPALEDLAAWLKIFFARLDEGVSPAALAGDWHWLLLAETLHQAGSCLAVFAELEHTLRAWEGVWSDRDLDTDTEAGLRRRWADLRRYADALFTASDSARSGGAGTPDRGPQTIWLVVDSPFRRSQLQQILTAGGYRAEVADDPVAAVAACLAAAGGAMICDNLEPSNHLLGVRRALTASGAVDPVPVILIATAAAGAEPQARDRALRLGATGLWLEPFTLSGLRQVL